MSYFGSQDEPCQEMMAVIERTPKSDSENSPSKNSKILSPKITAQIVQIPLKGQALSGKNATQILYNHLQ